MGHGRPVNHTRHLLVGISRAVTGDFAHCADQFMVPDAAVIGTGHGALFHPPTNQNFLSPHRQKRFDLNHHEAPPHNRKAGGHVLLKHVDPTDEYIERRFTKEKQSVVSFFTSKEEAEYAIHKVLRDNSY